MDGWIGSVIRTCVDYNGILPPPKVARCVMSPYHPSFFCYHPYFCRYHPHFCRPLLIAARGGLLPLPTSVVYM